MHNIGETQHPTTQRDSFRDLLGQLATTSAVVVHDEIALVIQGLREKGREVRSGAVTVAIGVVISVAAFLSLCAALIIGLSSYMAPTMAALVTGGALAFIGVVTAAIGYTHVKRSINIT